MIDPIELSQTLSQKLCHDLTGSIGAIEGSAGLIDSVDEAIRGRAIGLINYSSRELVSRLKFYRYAYGASYSDERGLIEEIHSLIKSMVAVSKGRVNLTFASKVDAVNSILGKIIACMFVTAFGACRAGELIIDMSKTQITFTINGKLFRQHTKNFAILKGELDANPLNVHNVHEYYLYYLSQRANCVLVINKSEDLSTFKIIPQS